MHQINTVWFVFRSVTGKDIGLKLMESSMILDTLGIKVEQSTVSDINRLFLDNERSHKGRCV